MAMYFRNIGPHVRAVNQAISRNDTLIIFDTETTGLEEDAKIIQFSAVLYQINQSDLSLTEMDSLNLYINPEQMLDDDIVALTGITNEQLALAKTETHVAATIFDFMNQSNLWCAYNAAFDLQKLEHMAKRTNTAYIKHQCIDAFLMARNIIPKETIKKHNLGAITKHLLPDYQAEFHNALEDVRATGKCLEKLLQLYQLAKIPETGSQKLNVAYAKFFINPNMQNMRRLKIYNTEGRDTGIFWDCSRSCWSCKSDAKSKKLFLQTDLPDVERQVLDKYYSRYQTMCIDDLARSWGHDYYEQNKDWLKSFKQKQKEPPEVEKDEEVEISLE